MSKKIKYWTTVVMIFTLIVMTLLAILAVWDVLHEDVAGKALTTMGIVFFASFVAVLIARFSEDSSSSSHILN